MDTLDTYNQYLIRAVWQTEHNEKVARAERNRQVAELKAAQRLEKKQSARSTKTPAIKPAVTKEAI